VDFGKAPEYANIQTLEFWRNVILME